MVPQDETCMIIPRDGSLGSNTRRTRAWAWYQSWVMTSFTISSMEGREAESGTTKGPLSCFACSEGSTGTCSSPAERSKATASSGPSHLVINLTKCTCDEWRSSLGTTHNTHASIAVQKQSFRLLTSFCVAIAFSVPELVDGVLWIVSRRNQNEAPLNVIVPSD